VTRVPTTSRRVGGLALAGVLGLGLLSGCSTDDEDPGTEESATPTATASETPTDPTAYLPAPDGVELTPPGTTVDLGEPAVLAWEPRQEEVAVVEATVERIDRTSFEESFQGWQVDKQTAAKTPYFASLQVENVSEDDLGGLPLPVYATDGGELLIEPTGFEGDFEPCPGGALPKRFRPGDRADLCLVFLTDPADDLEGVSFLPAAGLEPVIWSGRITRVEKEEPSRKDG